MDQKPQKSKRVCGADISSASVIYKEKAGEKNK